MKILNRLILAMLLTFLLVPLMSMVLWMFFASWEGEALFPSNFTLAWFRYFFLSGDWLVGVKSVVFSSGVALVSLALSIMLSRFFLQSNFRYKIQLETLFYLPMLLPLVGVCIGSHKMLLKLGLGGGLMVFLLHVYFALPYGFRMVYSLYKLWGVEQEQIARGLGAGRWRAFCEVNIPLYMNGYIGGFVMAFIISYSQYFINFFVGDYSSVNFSMIVTPYITASDRNLASVYIFMYMIYGVFVMLICSCIEKVYKRKRNKYEFFTTEKY